MMQSSQGPEADLGVCRLSRFFVFGRDLDGGGGEMEGVGGGVVGGLVGGKFAVLYIWVLGRCGKKSPRGGEWRIIDENFFLIFRFPFLLHRQ